MLLCQYFVSPFEKIHSSRIIYEQTFVHSLPSINTVKWKSAFSPEDKRIVIFGCVVPINKAETRTCFLVGRKKKVRSYWNTRVCKFSTKMFTYFGVLLLTTVKRDSRAGTFNFLNVRMCLYDFLSLRRFPTQQYGFLDYPEENGLHKKFESK